MNSYDYPAVRQLPTDPDDLCPFLEAHADAHDTAGALCRFILDPVNVHRSEWMGTKAVVAAAENLSLRLIYPRARNHRERELELKTAGEEINRLHKELRFLLAGEYFRTTAELNAWRGHRV